MYDFVCFALAKSEKHKNLNAERHFVHLLCGNEMQEPLTKQWDEIGLQTECVQKTPDDCTLIEFFEHMKRKSRCIDLSCTIYTKKLHICINHCYSRKKGAIWVEILS